MQLESQETKTILSYLKIILFEAKLDYSPSVDFAVVSVNGERIIFDKDKIKGLKSLVLKLEGEL